MESGNSTKLVRIYLADHELLRWKIRKEQMARNRDDVTSAEIIHEQLAGVRIEWRAEQRERGRNERQ
jgi:hypothetical protein